MAKLYFYYGSMSAGKSSLLIQTAHNYRERNMQTVTFKPLFDTRDSDTPKVVSRIGLSLDAIGLPDKYEDSIYVLLKHLHTGLDAVLIDEVQFLDVSTLKSIAHYCQDNNIPLMCYGLRNSFDNKGFPAADWLLRNADKLCEMKSICWCGNKATHNAMVVDGVFLTEANSTNMVLGDSIYKTLCYKHFRLKKLK